MKTYEFKAQLGQGIKGEEIIKEHFSKDWIIHPSSMEMQRIGIDFIFQPKSEGQSYRIEVKSDSTASKTGNAFIETWSVYPQKEGWAWTCQADFLFYFLPNDRLIYAFRPYKLRTNIARWETLYPSRQVPNKGYFTQGILVPLRELEQCSKVINL